MDVRELLEELFGRIPDHLHRAVDGLSAADLAEAPTPGANTIGWLVWHLTRVQDHHVSDLLGREQVWTTGPWPARFGLESDADDTGYGHHVDQVAKVRPDGPEVLIGYYEAVAARTAELLAAVTASDLDRVVDERWDPPVTLGVRLVSIADDDIQHAGQAAYLRGHPRPLKLCLMTRRLHVTWSTSSRIRLSRTVVAAMWVADLPDLSTPIEGHSSRLSVLRPAARRGGPVKEGCHDRHHRASAELTSVPLRWRRRPVRIPAVRGDNCPAVGASIVRRDASTPGRAHTPVDAARRARRARSVVPRHWFSGRGHPTGRPPNSARPRATRFDVTVLIETDSPDLISKVAARPPSPRCGPCCTNQRRVCEGTAHALREGDR